MFGAKSTAIEVIAGHDLSSVRAIVTGGTSGLGLETTRAFLSAGADVTLTGRDKSRGETAAGRLRAQTSNSAVALHRSTWGRWRPSGDFASHGPARCTC